jgi:hypothetical protein
MNFSITHRVSSDADTPISATPTETGSSQYVVDNSYGAGSTNIALAGSFPYAGVQSIYMLADSDLTLKTNSSGSPVPSFSLKAGRPYVWSVSDGYFANPFTVNVTGFYVTCSTSARLRIKILNA